MSGDIKTFVRVYVCPRIISETVQCKKMKCVLNLVVVVVVEGPLLSYLNVGSPRHDQSKTVRRQLLYA